MGLLDVRSPVGHGLPSGGLSVPVGSGERQGRCRSDQEPDGGQSCLRARAAAGRRTRQCGGPGGLGSIMEAKSLWNGAAHSGRGWRSKPSHRRGRDRLQQQELVKIKQREEHGTAWLLLQCSGGVCREGLFLLPYNELAVAQGPKIYQKNEL